VPVRSRHYNPAVATPWRPAGLACVIAILAIVVGPQLAARQAARPGPAGACPATTAPVVSPLAPADVCIPGGFKDVPIEYFDDYSWRTFIAMVWPAATGQRGSAAASRPLASSGPVVFETFKPLWEIFHRDGSDPEPSFSAYDRPAHNPCGHQSRFGDLVIGSFSGIDDIGQAGGGVLDGPLAAQNGRYVRTLTLFNQIAFDHIVKNRFYLRSGLPVIPSPRPDRPVIEFPMGSIAIKSAWVDVTGLDPGIVRRLHTRPVVLKRATGEGCTTTTMGLVGLHIAKKTPSRPQWIWTSFEHEDTVRPMRPNGPGVMLFDDGRRTPMPDVNPLPLVPLLPEPVTPYNVERYFFAPVHTLTDLLTYRYQERVRGTVWEFYRIVVTQWPRLEGDQSIPVPAAQDGSVPNTFPGLGAGTATSNVTMETFAQRTVQTGCMNCHNRARMAADFMWTIVDHAYPARLAPATSADR
jgi:hypothetical protein